MRFMQYRDLSLENNIESNTDSRIYEVGYLLAPTIAEEKVSEHYVALKDLVGSLDCETIADEMPRMISLAYTIEKIVQNVRSKYDTAYFGWVKFEMSPDKVLELKKKLDLNNDIVRFLLIKTIRENTVAAKRFVNRDAIRRKTPVVGENEVVAPINKEEIDKEIDAMVSA